MKPRNYLAGPPNAIAAWAIAAVANFGYLVLTGLAKPDSIAESLNPLMRIVWALLMASGGTLALTGVLWRGRISTGARMEIVGLLGAGGGCLTYGMALLLLTGTSGRGIGLWSVFIGVSCLHRALQVTRALTDMLADVQRRRVLGERHDG